jgi:hypothetical protein
MKTIVAALALLAAGLRAEAQDRWDKDLGKPAPRLVPAGWVGTPVSLDALRKSGENEATAGAPGATVDQKAEISGGNTVILAFWNADIPC